MEKIGIFFVFLSILFENGCNGADCGPNYVKLKVSDCIKNHNKHCYSYVNEDIGCPICECNDDADKVGDIVFPSEEEKKIAHYSFNTDYYRNVLLPQALAAPDGVQRGAGIPGHIRLWDIYRDSNGNPEIPYINVGTGLSSEMRDLLDQAIADFHQFTCLRFVVRTNQESYIRFQDNNEQSCYSNIGRVFSSNQPNVIQLHRTSCDTKGVIIHEIMHALGFWHEQARPDRDQFVRIIEENISDGFQSQFAIQPNINSLNSPYDIGSVMHYFSTIFSDPPGSFTITDLQGNRLNTQQARLAQSDIDQINILYGCTSATTTPATTPTEPTPPPDTTTTPTTTTQTTTTPTTTTPTTTTPTTTTPTTTTPTTTTPTTTTPTTTTPTTTTPTTTTPTTTPTTTTPTTTTPTTTTPTTTTPTTTTPTTTTPTTTTPTTTAPASTTIDTSSEPPIEEICKDLRSQGACDRKKDRGNCFRRVRKMKKICNDTCDLCGCEDVATSRTCRRAFRMELPNNPNRKRCYTHKQWALDNCRLTCRFCNHDPFDELYCEDLDPFCSYHDCSFYEEYSQVYCRGTCGYCGYGYKK